MPADPSLTKTQGSAQPIPKVVVATTAMLSFISFWRAAAIVLNDMGSSAFYAGAIAEEAFGKTAPWFILAVMLLAYAVCALYMESCSMFVRGGVYRVVKEAMGGRMAKLSVSALMFDFILTGPISGVSAGHYLVGFVNELLRFGHLNITIPENFSAASFAVAVTLYFWWENIKGIHESSGKALRIMYVTTAMVVVMLVWCGYTLWMRGVHLPPLQFDLL
jgi:amino acid transporter